MPASAADLIDSALFSAFSRKQCDEEEDGISTKVSHQNFPTSEQVLINSSNLNCVLKEKRILLVGLDSCHNLSNLKEKYGEVEGVKLRNVEKKFRMAHSKNDDKLEEPRTVLWSPDKIVLGWRKNFPPGAGMINLGNTCYMNSSLQALFHIPAMANWLLEEASTHIPNCGENAHNASYCSICGMMRTLKQALDRNSSVIKPSYVHNKLKCIGKTLNYGRQEDAHEFIKMLLDHMEKSFLSYMRASKLLDHRSKATTPLNQIFGGYLRQQGTDN